MDFKSLLLKALLEGYTTSDIDITTIFVCMGLTAVIGLYIFAMYKLLNRNSFYNKGFGLSLITLAVITAAIILTIQSNIVVSLGMVGALSIVRFRTAIKDPMDLVFLFWSISAGIICGAGYSMIAIVASLLITIIIIVVSLVPSEKGSMVLVVNSNEYIEDEILDIVDNNCINWIVRARNVSKKNVNLAIEVKVKHPHRLISELNEIDAVTLVSLVEHDGNITA